MTPTLTPAPSAQGDGDPSLDNPFPLDEPFTPEAPPPEPPGFALDNGPMTLPAHLVARGLRLAAQPQIPTMGRIVRYVTVGELHFPAVVVEAVGMDTTLSVFLPGAAHVDPQTAVPYDPLGKQPHSWHWPNLL